MRHPGEGGCSAWWWLWLGVVRARSVVVVDDETKPAHQHRLLLRTHTHARAREEAREVVGWGQGIRYVQAGATSTKNLPCMTGLCTHNSTQHTHTLSLSLFFLLTTFSRSSVLTCFATASRSSSPPPRRRTGSSWRRLSCRLA